MDHPFHSDRNAANGGESSEEKFDDNHVYEHLPLQRQSEEKANDGLFGTSAEGTVSTEPGGNEQQNTSNEMNYSTGSQNQQNMMHIPTIPPQLLSHTTVLSALQQLGGFPGNIGGLQELSRILEQAVGSQQPPTISVPAVNTNISGSVTDGSTRIKESKTVPCRARGVPADHNAKTAYFTIPIDIRHGQDLICSHNGCRRSGVKFRYCAHCGVPVARRHFPKRHDHKGVVFSDCGGKQEYRNNNATAPVHHNVPAAAAARKPPPTSSGLLLCGERSTTPRIDRFPNTTGTGTPLSTERDSASFTKNMKPPPVAMKMPSPVETSSLTGAGDRPTARIKGKGLNDLDHRLFRGKVVMEDSEAETRIFPPVAPDDLSYESPNDLPENIRFRHRKRNISPSSFSRPQNRWPSKKYKALKQSRTHESSSETSERRALVLPYDGARQLEWVSLLDQRPPSDEDDSMTLWLRRVLEVSDLEVPYRPKPLSRDREDRDPRQSSTSMTTTEASTSMTYASSSTPTTGDSTEVDHSTESASTITDEPEKSNKDGPNNSEQNVERNGSQPAGANTDHQHTTQQTREKEEQNSLNEAELQELPAESDLIENNNNRWNQGAHQPLLERIVRSDEDNGDDAGSDGSKKSTSNKGVDDQH